MCVFFANDLIFIVHARENYAKGKIGYSASFSSSK